MSLLDFVYMGSVVSGPVCLFTVQLLVDYEHYIIGFYVFSIDVDNNCASKINSGMAYLFKMGHYTLYMLIRNLCY